MSHLWSVSQQRCAAGGAEGAVWGWPRLSCGSRRGGRTAGGVGSAQGIWQGSPCWALRPCSRTPGPSTQATSPTHRRPAHHGPFGTFGMAPGPWHTCAKPCYELFVPVDQRVEHACAPLTTPHACRWQRTQMQAGSGRGTGQRPTGAAAQLAAAASRAGLPLHVIGTPQLAGQHPGPRRGWAPAASLHC